jgi:hypothetical protein
MNQTNVEEEEDVRLTEEMGERPNMEEICKI